MMDTILLVEDNALDEELTLRALAKSAVPAEVVVVRDGASALDYLFATGSYAGRDTSQLPTIVLLDLNLPKLGGLQVLERIRNDERTKRMTVVILTSSSEDDDISQANALGSNAYVRKLMGFAAFSEAIRVLTVFWLTLNERIPVRKPSPPSRPRRATNESDANNASDTEHGSPIDNTVSRGR